MTFLCLRQNVFCWAGTFTCTMKEETVQVTLLHLSRRPSLNAKVAMNPRSLSNIVGSAYLLEQNSCFFSDCAEKKFSGFLQRSGEKIASKVSEIALHSPLFQAFFLKFLTKDLCKIKNTGHNSLLGVVQRLHCHPVPWQSLKVELA